MDYFSLIKTGPELRAKANHYRQMAWGFTDSRTQSALKDLASRYDDMAEKQEKRDAAEVGALTSVN
jgi:hypothetical protein